mmetsp:Transcript_23805/g.38788  ORF Transcript_23805/g.38788 Transcript_23805/m.38788 type:complete len:380 (-) Transcript_23805:192-1331(-)|eukprot:CAMPEP_0178739992 /NCGR_PEP_ID=MMETSP0744-20121128/4351_1 /TAXON_ID=913974 /ORGANISM="Nitzschia punctata, Strain CCMP561" /LENGTH=379 /DNA_ID=CAMNT_0020392733 /DNA_START=62 /DNA_END=1201 /DNA_ORIENTATION=+
MNVKIMSHQNGNGSGNMNSPEQNEEKKSKPPSYCILFLYFDAIAYHLSLEYPKIFTKKNDTYLWMTLIPSLLVFELGYGISTRKSIVRVAPALLLTAYLGYRLHAIITASLVRAKVWADHRLDANPSAVQVIRDGVKEKRVCIEPNFFDLFLPRTHESSSTTTTTTSTSQQTLHRYKAGLVLFPGALVEYRAYAGVAKRLSDKGIVVLLFNTEHYHRFPIEIFGCNLSSVKRAIALLEQKYNLHVQDWSIGGHSLGGYTAQQVVNHQPTFFRNAVLWGIYRELIIGTSSINVLVVQATRDDLGKAFRENPQRRDFLDSLTRIRGRTSLHDIEGGNHGGFGDYAKQVFPAPDGDRTISLDDMHTELVQVTADFLLHDHKQ